MCELRTAACALVAVVLLSGCNDAKTSTAQASHAGRGLTVELPPGWRATKTNLTPNLGNPRQVLAVATYPLRYRPHRCAQVPVSALEDLGQKGAFVELEERAGEFRFYRADFPPRPAHLGSSAGVPSEAAACLSKTTRLSERWIGFKDHGRQFYARVAFGPGASKATRAEASGILDSLKVDPAVRPDWRAGG